MTNYEYYVQMLKDAGYTETDDLYTKYDEYETGNTGYGLYVAICTGIVNDIPIYSRLWFDSDDKFKRHNEVS